MHESNSVSVSKTPQVIKKGKPVGRTVRVEERGKNWRKKPIVDRGGGHGGRGGTPYGHSARMARGGLGSKLLEMECKS